MPIKVYSKTQKEKIKIELLETALKMYSKHGIRNVTLMEVLKPIGISKPFFYTYYDSVQDFVVDVLEYQWAKFIIFLDEVDTKFALNWEEKIYYVLNKVIFYNTAGFLIMTQEEEVWVRKRIDDTQYNRFMNRQILSFTNLLQRWDISTQRCNPKVFANMFLSIIIIHNSAKQSFPFLYLEDLDETAQAQAQSMIAYLKPLRNNPLKR